MASDGLYHRLLPDLDHQQPPSFESKFFLVLGLKPRTLCPKFNNQFDFIDRENRNQETLHALTR
jgi:hypothetical protein